MNYGARTSEDKRYHTDKMVEHAQGVRVAPDEWRRLERQVSDAVDWVDERGNAGDNVDVRALERLERAVEAHAAPSAVRNASTVLSGHMHPTARSIVGGAARQVIYTITHHHAHEFERGGEE